MSVFKSASRGDPFAVACRRCWSLALPPRAGGGARVGDGWSISDTRVGYRMTWFVAELPQSKGERRIGSGS